MLTQVDIQNYRSIYQSSVLLAPFTLLVGNNGVGKSNFLRLFEEASSNANSPTLDTVSRSVSLPRHRSFALKDQVLSIYNDREQVYSIKRTGDRFSYFSRDQDELVSSLTLELEDICSEMVEDYTQRSQLSELADVRVFSLDPRSAGRVEPIASQPTVQGDGTGLVQVLDSLKTGEREDLFDRIERVFKSYVPEIEKLSFSTDSSGKRSLQVQERCALTPVPLSGLSQGTQLVLTLITILNQRHRPSLICIEDIDRGLHSRLCRELIQLCLETSQREPRVQIIATTHNPYVIDELKHNAPEHTQYAVVRVKKENGQTQFEPVLETRSRIKEPAPLFLQSAS